MVLLFVPWSIDHTDPLLVNLIKRILVVFKTKLKSVNKKPHLYQIYLFSYGSFIEETRKTVRSIKLYMYMFVRKYKSFITHVSFLHLSASLKNA